MMIKVTPAWVLVSFFILGWTYYMVSTILMRGDIFATLRAYIEVKAETNHFFHFIKGMLGCLMCTSTETALWTLGLSTAILGMCYRFPDTVIGAILNCPVHLPWFVEMILMAMISFALSLAVAGEAWAIKTVVEHQEQKFLSLRDEYREREIELLRKISELETSAADQGFTFDLSEEA